MGMYTQLVLGINLKEDTPESVVDALRYMTGQAGRPDTLPCAELFQTDRWTYMLQCDSYYFDWETQVIFKLDDISKRWCLTVVTNLKNYNQEIEKLIDWLSPHIYTDGFLGFYRYEEDIYPTLIYKNESKIVTSSLSSAL